MSQDVSGLISWLRSWFDDIYAPKGSSGITFDDVYPVGAIYTSVNSTNPSTLFGGTWQRLEDTFLYATSDTADTFNTPPTDGTRGEATHTLTTNEMPTHSHKLNQWIYIVSSKGNSGRYNFSSGKLVNPMIDDPDQNRYSGNSGGGQAHNNMPPYMKVYMWKRTA